MTEYIQVRYYGIHTRFDQAFLKGLVDTVAYGCKFVKVAGGRELPPRPASELASLLYNNGKGGSLFFGTEIHSFSLSASKEKNELRIVLSFPHHGFNSAPETVYSDIMGRGKAVFSYVNSGYAHGDWDEALGSEEKGIAHSRNIFWLNFYDSTIVDKIGLHKLRAIPYGRLEEIAGGAVVLVMGDNPDAYAPEHKEAVRKHLFEGRSILDRFRGR